MAAVSIEGLFAIAQQLTPAEVAAHVASAEADLQTARSHKNDAIALLTDRTERRTRWAARAINLQADAAAERGKKIDLLLKGSSKASLEALSAARTIAASTVAVITEIVQGVDATIQQADRAVKLTDLALKIAERDFWMASGIAAAREAYDAMAGLLKIEGNVEINMNDSRVAAFVKRILETETDIEALKGQL